MIPRLQPIPPRDGVRLSPSFPGDGHTQRPGASSAPLLFQGTLPPAEEEKALQILDEYLLFEPGKAPWTGFQLIQHFVRGDGSDRFEKSLSQYSDNFQHCSLRQFDAALHRLREGGLVDKVHPKYEGTYVFYLTPLAITLASQSERVSTLRKRMTDQALFFQNPRTRLSGRQLLGHLQKACEQPVSKKQICSTAVATDKLLAGLPGGAPVDEPALVYQLESLRACGLVEMIDGRVNRPGVGWQKLSLWRISDAGRAALKTPGPPPGADLKSLGGEVPAWEQMLFEDTERRLSAMKQGQAAELARIQQESAELAAAIEKDKAHLAALEQLNATHQEALRTETDPVQQQVWQEEIGHRTGRILKRHLEMGDRQRRLEKLQQERRLYDQVMTEAIAQIEEDLAMQKSLLAQSRFERQVRQLEQDLRQLSLDQGKPLIPPPPATTIARAKAPGKPPQ